MNSRIATDAPKTAAYHARRRKLVLRRNLPGNTLANARKALTLDPYTALDQSVVTEWRGGFHDSAPR